MLIDLIMSGDNVGVIALAVSRLPKKFARRAKLIGIAGALSLRVVFVFCISILLSLRWLHLDLIGGVLLLWITKSLLRENQKPPKASRGETRFFRAVFSIVAADAGMSFDNVLAISSVVVQNGEQPGFRELALIVFGLAFCVPVLFFGSSLVARLLNRYPIVNWLCAAVLVDAALRMIFGDDFLAPVFGGSVRAAALAPALIVLLYGTLVSFRTAEALRKAEK